MDKFVVRGGNPLLGTIKVSGAKNSALPCMAAAILTEDEIILENIPQVRDIETERKLLVSMGAEVELGYGRAQHRTRIKCAILSDHRRQVRDRQDHACQFPRPWPAHRPHRHRPRSHARRLRGRCAATTRTCLDDLVLNVGRSGRMAHAGAV